MKKHYEKPELTKRVMLANIVAQQNGNGLIISTIRRALPTDDA